MDFAVCICQKTVDGKSQKISAGIDIAHGLYEKRVKMGDSSL